MKRDLQNSHKLQKSGKDSQNKKTCVTDPSGVNIAVIIEFEAGVDYHWVEK